MSPRLLLTSLALSLVITACQKEVEAELAEPQPVPPQARLEGIVYKQSATDSSVTDLLYDAAGRFVGFDAPDGDLLLGGYVGSRIVRDANGFIQSYTVRDVTATGQEETNYRVVYDAARRQYAYRISETSFNGIPLRDSTVFDYASGRLNASRFLIREPQSGISDTLGKYEFTYDGTGNLNKVRTLVADSLSSNLNPIADLLLTYDTRVNPLPLGSEGVVLDQLFFVSPANFTQVAVQDLRTASPVENVFQLTYTYRTDGRPEAAVVQGDGVSFEIRFRYN